jgi:hypothetical protein
MPPMSWQLPANRREAFSTCLRRRSKCRCMVRQQLISNPAKAFCKSITHRRCRWTRLDGYDLSGSEAIRRLARIGNAVRSTIA